MAHQTCGSCAHFVLLPEGTCHRNPPTALPVPGPGGAPMTFPIWPPVRTDTIGCGEHSKYGTNSLVYPSGSAS